MAVKFLSEDWAQAVSRAANSDERFREATKGAQLGLQFVVDQVPDREDVHFFVSLTDGRARVERGDLPDPDATIHNGYDTAVGIFTGELDTQTAFITGKIKVQGNLAKLISHQAALSQLARAVGDVDIEK